MLQAKLLDYQVVDTPMYGFATTVAELAEWVAADEFYTLTQVTVGAKLQVTVRAKLIVLENIDV